MEKVCKWSYNQWSRRLEAWRGPASCLAVICTVMETGRPARIACPGRGCSAAIYSTLNFFCWYIVNVFNRRSSLKFYKGSHLPIQMALSKTPPSPIWYFLDRNLLLGPSHFSLYFSSVVLPLVLVRRVSLQASEGESCSWYTVPYTSRRCHQAFLFSCVRYTISQFSRYMYCRVHQ